MTRKISPSRIIDALSHVTRATSTARKLLIVPDVNYGRELLAQLARSIGGWIGWEAVTLKQIADELTLVACHQQHIQRAGDVRIRVLVNEALDRTVTQGRVQRLTILQHSLGFRETLRNSILELRMARISPDELRQAVNAEPLGFVSESASEVATVMREYETLLVEHRYADAARIFQMAIDAFDEESAFVLEGSTIVVAPTILDRGLPGMLLRRILDRGAQVLSADTPANLTRPSVFVRPPVTDVEVEAEERDTLTLLSWLNHPALPDKNDSRIAWDAVSIDLFAAVTPSEELREICRRVIAEGLRWDEVEIVATDPDTYGIALDNLCQQLGISATMLQGIPYERTRIGRALERWFVWLQDGLPADQLREALEAGEISFSATSHGEIAVSLARDLREAKIGWGRPRYEQTIANLESGTKLNTLKRGTDETLEMFEARCEAARVSVTRFKDWLRNLIDLLPSVPERGDTAVVRCAPATLANATARWVALIPIHGPEDQQTTERILRRLAQLETDTHETGFTTTVAIVRDALRDVRAWPATSGVRNPWQACGGMLHLTDLAHAGTTGRPRVFVVGLDVDRTGGIRRQDPLLPDNLRQYVTGGRLSTTTERREISQYQLYASFAALRGTVTFSYATSSTLDGRESGPGIIMLQAFRMIHGNMSLSYTDLRSALFPPSCAVPVQDSGDTQRQTALLDTRDVWLDSLCDGPLLLDGESLVCRVYEFLDAGLKSILTANGDEITPYHGIIAQAAGVFAPRAVKANASIPSSLPKRFNRGLSPSALELLSTCPLAWFYRHGLKISPPNDPEYDSAQWLDSAQRGILLHEVFEQFCTAYLNRQDEIDDDEARATLEAITETAITDWRTQVPPPSDTAFQREAAEIRGDALTFLDMERHRRKSGDQGEWRQLEVGFGWDGTLADYVLDDNLSLSVIGRIDRVDELPDGSYRVIDYKTGKSTRYMKNPKAGLFNGGRHLQGALYASVLERILGKPVTAFEYRFPTQRGNSEIVTYETHELLSARSIVIALLEYLKTGHFISTTDAKDCHYCDFRDICRVEIDRYNKTFSPRAAWAAAHAETHPHFVSMLTRRTPEPKA